MGYVLVLVLFLLDVYCRFCFCSRLSFIYLIDAVIKRPLQAGWDCGEIKEGKPYGLRRS